MCEKICDVRIKIEDMGQPYWMWTREYEKLGINY